MTTYFSALLTLRNNVLMVYLNGMETASIQNGVAALRQFVYPTTVVQIAVQNLPKPLPHGPAATLENTLQAAFEVFRRYPLTVVDHSRLYLLREDGVQETYLNGLPMKLGDLTDVEAIHPLLPQLLTLAKQADTPTKGVESST